MLLLLLEICDAEFRWSMRINIEDITLENKGKEALKIAKYN